MKVDLASKLTKEERDVLNRLSVKLENIQDPKDKKKLVEEITTLLFNIPGKTVKVRNVIFLCGATQSASSTEHVLEAVDISNSDDEEIDTDKGAVTYQSIEDISSGKKDHQDTMIVAVNTEEPKLPLDDDKFFDPWKCYLLCEQLMDVDRIAQTRGIRWYIKARMKNIVKGIVKPICVETKKTYVETQNPQGLMIQAFITLSWDENFKELV